VTAWILGGLPFLVTVLLLLTNPYYLLPLIEDPRGNGIVAAAVGMLTLGLIAMRHMMRRVTRL
jgi:tight adherence protein B